MSSHDLSRLYTRTPRHSAGKLFQFVLVSLIGHREFAHLLILLRTYFFSPLPFFLPSSFSPEVSRDASAKLRVDKSFDNEICIRRGFEQKIWLIKFSKRRKCVIKQRLLGFLKDEFGDRFLDSFVSIFNRGLFI